EANLRSFFIESAMYLFNFKDAKDIDLSTVKTLVVVDTRQKSRIAHVAPVLHNPDLEIHLYDHHPDSDDDLVPTYSRFENWGSCTTIITHMIMEKGIALTEDEATMLGLGIYEDTGSFTFNSSTPQDFAAAGWLLQQGMDCMRINCAHDNPEIWRKMIGHLSKAKLELNRPCKICMDLAGPNPRTKLFDSSDTSRKFVLGDKIRLTKGPTGQPDIAEIGCSCPEIITDLKVNERLFIDDGKFEAIVRHTGESWVDLEITRVSPEGKKIKKEKGLNAPDSELSFSSLTEFDREVLPFVVEHGDIVGMSFIRHPDDIFELNDELHRLKGDNLGLLLKIETVPAFRLFPRLLLAGMGRPKVGVMIARGDMAVESGYERLAEIQEE
ncbi:MAG: pyruvate kinase, partial [Desulfobacterales bacterium]|nr:pyruvate kinase [Desulfobacterales bacterium]